MRIVLRSCAIERLTHRILDTLVAAALERIEISERALCLHGLFNFTTCKVLKLDASPDHVPQTLLEQVGSVQFSGDAVSQHLLQPCSAVADAPEEKMIERKKEKSDIPPH